MPRMQLPEKLLPLVQKQKRYKIVIGGRGSAKSQSVADICLMDAQTKGIKTGCFREYQKSIDDSVHSLLCGEIERLDLKGFDPQKAVIKYGEQEAFKFRGLARDPEGVKSMHGFKRFWVEEAQTTSHASLRALTPTLRMDDSEIWMTGNPRSSVDAFSQRFIKPFEQQLRRDHYYEDDLHLIIWVNHNDNPFFPAVLENERLYDAMNMSPALYRHVWEGEYYDEVEDTIIPVEWFDAAIDAHNKLGFRAEGAVITAHDPSDEGGDSKGIAIRKGAVILDVQELVTGDAAEGMDWALDMARSNHSDWFVWDCDGLGAALKRQVATQFDDTNVRYEMFKGSMAAEEADAIYAGKLTNRDTFLNRRAQYYFRLRDRFEKTFKAVTKKEYVAPDEMISLSPDIKCLDQLRSEVCRIPQKRNTSGKFQILSKTEMMKKPYELPSPNMADSLMMSMFAPRIATKARAKINFKGWN